MAIEQLIIGTFNKSFNKYIYDDLIIGQLAHTEFKNGVKKGDEVDIEMPVLQRLFDYTGGDLPDAEVVTSSSTKVRIDRGKAFHFEVKKLDEQQIENAPDMKQKVDLAKRYSEDGIKQFASAIDQAYASLYTRAGHYLDNDGDAIALDANTAKDILAYMQAKFQRGDGKGHTSWVDGQMVVIVPPEYQFYLGKLEDLKYVESGHKKMAKGFIGQLCGWDIHVSNNIAQNEDGSMYPLFGIKGKTLAGGVSSDLNMQHYIPEKNFNTRYKGYGLYGVGAPRADYFGTVKIKAPLTLKAA